MVSSRQRRLALSSLLLAAARGISLKMVAFL
jgi:hypothetical protein